ncbi:MAG: AEC family transporter [Oscillospiraceae bacterium]|nr:AEC family transporter [Oscillospiraceae bacterium]MDY3937784.1 AEC family transporter [Oscillospiraceae bacterium]
MELFLTNAGTAAKQVAILYVLVAIGFIAEKTNVFSRDTAKKANKLLFCIVTPFVIINSFLSMEFTAEKAKGLALAVLFAFLIHITAIILDIPFFNKLDPDDACVYKFGSIYGNVGYMALPLAGAILGEQGIFYCSAGVIAHNVMAFTHGVWLMNKSSGKNKFELKSIIINPGVISVIIGLPLFIFSVKLPEIIQTPIDYIASLNTPLAMLILGTYIANADLKTLFSVKEQYISALIKLILNPAVMLILFKLLKIDPIIAAACTVSASAPSANNSVMFSAMYDKDTAKASKNVAFSDLVSIITMPMMIAAAQTL